MAFSYPKRQMPANPTKKLAFRFVFHQVCTIFASTNRYAGVSSVADTSEMLVYQCKALQ